MNEDKARELYEAHKWHRAELAEFAQHVLYAYPKSDERTNAVRSLIRLDRFNHRESLEAERSNWFAQAQQAKDKIAEIDAELAALRGES